MSPSASSKITNNCTTGSERKVPAVAKADNIVRKATKDDALSPSTVDGPAHAIKPLLVPALTPDFAATPAPHFAPAPHSAPATTATASPSVASTTAPASNRPTPTASFDEAPASDVTKIIARPAAAAYHSNFVAPASNHPTPPASFEEAPAPASDVDKDKGTKIVATPAAAAYHSNFVSRDDVTL